MAQISLKALAEVCHRAATSHAAGVDARKIWKREAGQGPPKKQREFKKISQAVEKGSTLADAMDLTGNYLPQLVRDMVHVGERTGRVDESLNRLGQYYEHMRSVRTGFLVGIAWPVVQLVMAILVIGLVIWIMGILQEKNNTSADILGLGLIGNRGVAIYFSVVGVLFVCGFFFMRSLAKGKLSGIIMVPMMKLPAIGKWLRLMAMSRMAWALGMAVESGMDATNCTEVALRSTQNSFFTRHKKSIHESIMHGESLYDAFLATDAFSVEFLDAVQVGEETGKLTESMERLSRQYEEQGKAAMQAVAVAAGVIVWGFVASVIIFFIFRIAAFYLGLLNGLLDGTF